MGTFFAAVGGVGIIIGLVILLAIAAVIGLIVVLLMRAWYKVARADEALVIVGRRGKGKNKSVDSALTVVRGGGAIVNPITQRAETLSLRARQIMVQPTAQSIQGVTVDVTGVALVKVGSDREAIARAAERFVSQDKAIEVFTTEQLEGALRGVVATLSVEQLMRDRQELSDQIATLIKSDLDEQGLVLDSFQIQGITDMNGYVHALGAEEVSKVKRQAEIARIDAERQIKAREISTSEETLIEQTAYDKNQASAAADVGEARAEAEQAEALARARAEQGVLMQQADNRQAQLDADVKRVADASQYEEQKKADARAYAQVKDAEARADVQRREADIYQYEQQKRADAEAYSRIKEAEADAQRAEREAEATRLKAQADADAERARAQAAAEAVRLAGEAKAAAIEAEAEALKKNQDAILAQRSLDVLVPMMTEFAKGYANVGNVTVLSGSGSGEGGASTHMAGEAAMGMRAMFDTVREATGVDLSSVLQGAAVGRGIASGQAQAAPESQAPARKKFAPSEEKSVPSED
ncbi:SPFH domain-containing protein [Microbacterium amylolyticum]|uniref:Flotillin n=1 Tax=Microbacterium amylolyticum TaxID=936337 RepID=A0ABS4ZJI0_9MICO|nr:flotillin family protein [Microbacterium amylolyticum]MBP2437439.1 flotillin [Microbacterium amylolyticum]